MNIKRASQLRRSKRISKKLCSKSLGSKFSQSMQPTFLSKKEKQNISEMLFKIKSMHPTAQFELWARMVEDHSLDLKQLGAIKTAIEDRIRFDIISNVPVDIAHYIMSFLEPKDLCLAAQTCRAWRYIAEDNRLWREFCREEGVLGEYQTIEALSKERVYRNHAIQNRYAAKSTPEESASRWKKIYMEHVTILRNWRNRDFKIKEPFIVPSPASNNNQVTEQNRERPGSCNRAHINAPKVFRFARRNVARRGNYRSVGEGSSELWQSDLVSFAETDSRVHECNSECARFSQRNENPQLVHRDMMQLRCHEDSVITCLQFNPQSKIIVSGSDDQTLKVWSSDTGHCIHTLEGHNGGVWSSQLHPEDIVVSGSTDRTLRVWNAKSGKLLHVLTGHTSTVRCLALDGDLVVSGSRDQTLRIWNIRRGRCLEVLPGHTAAVRCVEFKNGTIVSGAYDCSVRVWDATTGHLIHQFDDHDSRIYSLQFDGRTIASGSLDTNICVWDAKTGILRHKLRGHESLTSKMQLRGDVLVSANADSYAKIWDLKTGQCIHTLEGPNKHTGAITSVYFNSQHVVTSSDDGTVKLWETKTGNFIRDLVVLPTASNGGVVWRIRASYTKLICAVGSRTETEDTHLLVLDFS